MKRKNLRFGRGFRVVLRNRRSRAAEMVLPPGKSEGGGDNRHRGADHEVRNTGRGAPCTLNFHVPPAYDSGGDELPRGKS